MVVKIVRLNEFVNKMSVPVTQLHTHLIFLNGYFCTSVGTLLMGTSVSTLLVGTIFVDIRPGKEVGGKEEGDEEKRDKEEGGGEG